jgi:hypothetical protein
MTLFKKKISSKEMAKGLYHTVISNSIRTDLRDQDGNIILTMKEQSLMLAQYLYNLVESSNLGELKSHILLTYVANNCEYKMKEDPVIYLTASLTEFNKVGDYIKDVLSESHKFFNEAFLFGKDLDFIQKILIVVWYVEQCKIIDSTFQLGIKNFKIVDKE